MTTLTFGELAMIDGLQVVGDADTRVERAVVDSRDVGPGALFVSIDSDVERSQAHVRDAVARGAVAVASRHRVEVGVPSVITASPGRMLGRIAECLAGFPTSKLVTIGVTGTNGKTTTTQLIEQALIAVGSRPALIGTGVLRGPQGEHASSFTTPFGDAISAFASESLAAGATHLVMEVSSHALEQGRADGISFRVGAFTNLTRDHLDYHGTMASYGASKARLFADFPISMSVVHVGDEFGRHLASTSTVPVLSVSIDGASDIRAVDASFDIDGIHASVITPFGTGALVSPLVGRHNLENLLVALGCLLAVDVTLEDALRGLAGARGAPGRLERVEHSEIGIFVDYAHTPDALERVLVALRPLTRGRLIVVFGCGGDRDRGKRPEMGRVAALGADLTIITSDNPRTESPEVIVADIVGGVPADGCPRIAPERLDEVAHGYAVVIDRRAAITLAVGSARAGDTVLIAGKGHEDYQIIGKHKSPFDDRVEARAALDSRGRAA